MTRLRADWIASISASLEAYRLELLEKTGMDLTAIAVAAADLSVDRLVSSSHSTKVGVVPITSGQGIIGCFSDTVAAVCRSMDFHAFVTEGKDTQGIYEAHLSGAEILFMADDNRFIAINLKTGTLAENSEATAEGFVAALAGAAGGLMNREVLVLGCGVVGLCALKRLHALGAKPVAYDQDTKALNAAMAQGYETIQHSQEIKNYEFIIDATSEGGWLNFEMIHPDAFIAAPGVPLSLDPDAYRIYEKRLIHDLLPIGVATMLAMACK